VRQRRCIANRGRQQVADVGAQRGDVGMRPRESLLTAFGRAPTEHAEEIHHTRVVQPLAVIRSNAAAVSNRRLSMDE